MSQRRYRVTFEPSGRFAEVYEGSTILDAAHSIDLHLDHVCGGACACATCHIIVRQGIEHLNAQSDDEKDMISTASRPTSNSRLACQTEVMTHLVVEIPR